MKLIAHRGLVSGPDREIENSPAQICRALALGYDCEIDLWVVSEQLYLGHDGPQYPVNPEFVINPRFWVHAKNLAALQWLLNYRSSVNFFWHDQDAYAVTSWGNIWTCNMRDDDANSVVVLLRPPVAGDLKMNCLGICSDYSLELEQLRTK